MPDRMSNTVLFETEEEVKAYKSVLGEGYKINVEAYVRYLQEKFPNLEKYSIEKVLPKLMTEYMSVTAEPANK